MEKDKQKTKKRYLLIFLLLFLLFLASCNAFMAKSNNDKPVIRPTISTPKEKEDDTSITTDTVKEHIQQSHSIAIVTSDGGSAVTNVNTAFAGENINIAITPDIDYEVVEIRLNDTPLNAVEFIMPNEDVVIYIGFIAIGAPRYQILKDNVKDGKFTTDKSIVTVNESFNIKTYPDVGYEFDKITATNATVNGFKATARGTGDITVKVEFEKTVWKITDNKDTVQNGSFTVDKTTAVLDDVIKVVLSPNIGYKLDTITATNATVNGTDIVATGTGDIDIEVTFKKIIWNIKSNEKTVQNGTFSLDKFTVAIDEIITVTLSPALGYEVDTITATNATVNGTDITSTGTGDIEVTVSFKKITWSVKSNKDTVQNGSFTIDKTSIVIDGESIVKVSPDVGYELDKITATNATVSGNKVISKGTGDIDIEVTFKKIVWKITDNKDTVQNGSFTVDKTTAVLDDVIKVVLSPNVGYKLDTITATNAIVNGTDITSTGTGDIDINVTFKKIIWNVSSNEKTVQNGSFTVDKTTAVLDDVIKVVLSPNIGYKLDTITATNATVNGTDIVATGTGDIDIEVTFKKIIWNIKSNEKTVQNGTFSLDKFTVAIDEIITVTLSPNVGYKLDTITATNAIVNGNNIISTGTGDVDIIVTYKKNIVKVTSNKDTVQNGSFTVDKTTALVGDTILIDTTINTGYEIDKITATNATVNGNKIIATGTGDIHINVSYKKIIWKVKRSVPQNGDLALTRETAGIGDEVIASLAPDTGYVLESFTATNAIVQNDTIISDGTGDIEVDAVYRKKNDYLTLNGNEYPAITGGWTSTIAYANGYNSYYNTGSSLYLTINWWQTQCHQIRTARQVDMTDIEMLVANVSGAKHALGDDATDAMLSFCVQSAATSGYYNQGVARVSNQVRNPWGSYRFVVDVADLTGFYYPALRLWGLSSTVEAYLNSVEVVYKDKTPKPTPNYLYLNGNEYIPNTAGWNYVQPGGNSSGTLQKNSTSMYFKSHWWSSHYASAVTSRKIDLSNVKQIEATLSGSNTLLGDKGGATGYLSLEIQNSPNGSAVASSFWGSPQGDRTLVVDTSKLNDSYHIAIKGGGYDSNVNTNITAVKVVFNDGTTKTIKSEFVDTEKLNTHKINKSVATNGTYTLPSSAVHKEKVTIDVTPSIGYTLEYIKVNNAVIVGKSFVMPDEDVNVEVLFVPIQ